MSREGSMTPSLVELPAGLACLSWVQRQTGRGCPQSDPSRAGRLACEVSSPHTMGNSWLPFSEGRLILVGGVARVGPVTGVAGSIRPCADSFRPGLPAQGPSLRL